MARCRYLVAYDIREDRRPWNVAACCEGYGERIQYSVFICDLPDEEAVTMRGGIEVRVKHPEDGVMIIDLGKAGAQVVTPMPGSARAQVRGMICILTTPQRQENMALNGTARKRPRLRRSSGPNFASTDSAPQRAAPLRRQHPGRLPRDRGA